MASTAPTDFTAELQGVMDDAMKKMMEIMETSIKFQTETTRITTYAGQVATRAAKQTPQG